MTMMGFFLGLGRAGVRVRGAARRGRCHAECVGQTRVRGMLILLFVFYL